MPRPTLGAIVRAALNIAIGSDETGLSAEAGTKRQYGFGIETAYSWRLSWPPRARSLRIGRLTIAAWSPSTMLPACQGSDANGQGHVCGISEECTVCAVGRVLGTKEVHLVWDDDAPGAKILDVQIGVTRRWRPHRSSWQKLVDAGLPIHDYDSASISWGREVHHAG